MSDMTPPKQRYRGNDWGFRVSGKNYYRKDFKEVETEDSGSRKRKQVPDNQQKDRKS